MYPEQVKAIFIRRAPEKTQTPTQVSFQTHQSSGEAETDVHVESVIIDSHFTTSRGSHYNHTTPQYYRRHYHVGSVMTDEDSTTQFRVDVSERDSECLVQMTKERKEAERIRFTPLFEPLKEHTLCRVFSCPSEIANIVVL